MDVNTAGVLELLDSVKIDKFYIICHFKCSITEKAIISTLAFEPYHGKIEISVKDMILHPFRSYHKYYHTPIIIYDNKSQETIVLKAFERIQQYFRWDHNIQKYVFRESEEK